MGGATMTGNSLIDAAVPIARWYGMLISTSCGQCGPCCSIDPTGTMTTGFCVSAASNSCRSNSCQRTFLPLAGRTSIVARLFCLSCPFLGQDRQLSPLPPVQAWVDWQRHRHPTDRPGTEEINVERAGTAPG